MWESQDQPMTSAPEDQFHDFLDMTSMGNVSEEIQFDFNGLQQTSGQPMAADQNGTVMHDAMMSNYGNPVLMSNNHGGMMQNHGHSHTSSSMPPSHGNTQMNSHMMTSSQPHGHGHGHGHAQGESISDIDAQIHYLQQQKLQQQRRQMQDHHHSQVYPSQNNGHSVPPTPSSLEMPPGSGQMYSQAEHTPHSGVFDGGFQQFRDQQDMAFTPLVSPAVTPLDPFFNMENTFAIPGAYFSPLTSPALHAQSDSNLSYDPSTHSNNSPVEMELETHVPAPAPQSKDLSKTARKNNAAKARKPGVKSSPIVKANSRKKTGPSPAMVSQVLSQVEERNTAGLDNAMLPLPATSTNGSDENASVSPENLNEMPPPPVPVRRSNSKSPYIQPQSNNSNTSTSAQNATSAAKATSRGGHQRQTQKAKQQQQLAPQPPQQQPQQQHPPHPATPASLMRLPSSNTTTPVAQYEEPATDFIEALELPESVSSQASASNPAREQHLEAAQNGPSNSTKPSPNIKSAEARVTPSPQLKPGSSGPSAKKTPQLSARNSKRRSGSVQISPALLPRISPNIKPLLPGSRATSSAEDTVSQLLTSKSNYQNIMEGNTVPGVSYSSELSTNLNLKRTSHKIAEQGRRNRINAALQIMASMLPDHDNMSPLMGEDSEKKDKQANASNSKAGVVESAIDHMKTLQQENVDLKQELQDLKQQLDDMKDAS